METEVYNDIYIHRSTIPVDDSIERIKYKSFIPQSKADINLSGHEIEIDIPASDANYIPSKSFLKIKGRLATLGSTFTWANTYTLSLGSISTLLNCVPGVPSRFILYTEAAPPMSFTDESRSFWLFSLMILNVR